MFELNSVYDWMALVGIERQNLLLGLALAYLAYALLHTLDGVLERFHGIWSRWLRRAAETALIITVYLVSVIYGLEYVLETVAHA